VGVAEKKDDMDQIPTDPFQQTSETQPKLPTDAPSPLPQPSDPLAQTTPIPWTPAAARLSSSRPLYRRRPWLIGAAVLVLITLIGGLALSHSGGSNSPSPTHNTDVTSASGTPTTAPTATRVPTVAPTPTDTILPTEAPTQAPTQAPSPQGGAVSPTAVSGPLHGQSFASGSDIVGVAVDGSGNVYATSDNVSNILLRKFSASGQVLTYTTYGSFSSIGAIGYLGFDTQGILWDVTQTGAVIEWNQNLQAVTQFTLPTSISLSQVYNVTTGQNAPFSIYGAAYGDMAFSADGHYAFVTGFDNSHVYPFVMRLTLTPGQTPTYTVVAFGLAESSSGSIPSGTRGIGINPSGLVVTTLPTLVSDGDTLDHLITFSTDFQNGSGAQAPQVMWSADFASEGIDVDGSGNIFVAEGPTGSTLCGGASGAVVVISPDFARFSCYAPNGTTPLSRDIAVASDGSAAYVTVHPLYGSDAILKMS
jgi:hypothetical protein